MKELFPADKNDPNSLLFRYIDIVNSRAYDSFGELFTEDAVLEAEGLEPASGRAAVVALLQSLAAGVSDAVQLVHGSALVVDGPVATARTYVSESVRIKDGAGFLIVGVYDDELRLTGDGWRFSHRRFRSLCRNKTDGSGVWSRPTDQ